MSSAEKFSKVVPEVFVHEGVNDWIRHIVSEVQVEHCHAVFNELQCHQEGRDERHNEHDCHYKQHGGCLEVGHAVTVTSLGGLAARLSLLGAAHNASSWTILHRHCLYLGVSIDCGEECLLSGRARVAIAVCCGRLCGQHHGQTLALLLLALGAAGQH